MQIRPMNVPGSFVITPVQHRDDRGVFLEHFRLDVLENAIGGSFELRQANTSVSRRGSVRGIHFADIPPGQAKYVTVPRGAAMDYVVDIRTGSPTFGSWDSVRLDDVDRRSVYIAEGLGHCFVALEEDTALTYLVSDVYRPDREHGIDPLDEELALEFPLPADELVISPKDAAAPSLGEAERSGLLPAWSIA